MSETDAREIDALDQWCLRVLLGVGRCRFVRSGDVRGLAGRPRLAAVVQSRRLALFGHIMRMDDSADAGRVLLASPPAGWGGTAGSSPRRMARRRPAGSGTSPSCAPRGGGFGSGPPSVEDDVDVWRYAIVSCMPETTMTNVHVEQLC